MGIVLYDAIWYNTQMKKEVPTTSTLGAGANTFELALPTLNNVVEVYRQANHAKYASALALAAEHMVPTENGSPASPDQLGKFMLQRGAEREQARTLLGSMSAKDRLGVLSTDAGSRITSMPLAWLGEADPAAFQGQNDVIQAITEGLKDSGDFKQVRGFTPTEPNQQVSNRLIRDIHSPRADSQRVMADKQFVCLSTQVFNLATFHRPETQDNFVLQRRLAVVRGSEDVNPYVRKVRNFNRSPYTMLMPGVGNRTLEVFAASSLWAHVQRGQN